MLGREQFLYQRTEFKVFGHYLNQLECQLITDINQGTQLGILPYRHRCLEISQGEGILAQVPWIIVFTPGESLLEYCKVEDLYPIEEYERSVAFIATPWELSGIYIKLVEK